MNLLYLLFAGLKSNLNLIVAGLVVWLVLALGRRRASIEAGDFEGMESLGTWLLIGLLAGARLLAIIPAAVEQGIDLRSVLRINQGLSLYGALGGAAAALALFAKRHRLRMPVLADAYVLFLPLAIALFRAGCLVYGFCGGRPTSGPFGFQMPGQLGYRYPSDPIEALYSLALFFLLLGLSRRRLPAGLLTAVWLVLYPPVHGAIDLTRFSDGPWPWLGIVLSAATTAVGLGVALVVTVRARGSDRDAGDEPVPAQGRGAT